jgi:hypothetical protein
MGNLFDGQVLFLDLLLHGKKIENEMERKNGIGRNMNR